MFNWLKDWLNPTPYNSTTTFECNAPMPKVKAPKVEGVSEPVLSMLKVWESDKKRFTVSVNHNLKFNQNFNLFKNTATATIVFFDVLTKEKFEIFGELEYEAYRAFYNQIWFLDKSDLFGFKVYPNLGFKVVSYPSWLTVQEIEFLQKNIQPFYNKRVLRHMDLIQARLDRKETVNHRKSNLAKEEERLRLTKIYGEQQ